MKTLVTLMTFAGDTKKLAETIFAEIQGAKDIKPRDELPPCKGMT